ncbi:MAG: nucleotide exchange factor GrpE [Myxococcota bacterium]
MASEDEEHGVQDDTPNPEHEDLFLDPEDEDVEVAQDVIVLSVSDVEEAERALESDDPVVAATSAVEEAAPSSEVSDSVREEMERLRAEVERAQVAEAEALSQLGQLRQEVERVRGERDEAKDERDDLKSRLLRRVADHDNYRKRIEREKTDLRKYAAEPLVRDLLQAVDNLERALEHAERANDANSILQGVKMVYRQMVGFFERHGIKGFEAEGEMFDPQLHEAMQQIPTPDHETNRILQVYQKGYFMHDRLIRAARVVVALHQASPDSELEEETSALEENGLEDGSDVTEEESEVIGMPGPEEPLELSEAAEELDVDADATEAEEHGEEPVPVAEQGDEGEAVAAEADATEEKEYAQGGASSADTEGVSKAQAFVGEPTVRLEPALETLREDPPKKPEQGPLGSVQSEVSDTDGSPDVDASTLGGPIGEEGGPSVSE